MSDSAQNKSLGSKALDLAFEMPATIIDRDEYLTSCFQSKFSEEKVKEIIKTSPIKAQINKELLHMLAEDSISYEKFLATTTSAVTGLPGGWAAVPASVADAAQFLSHEMRLVQKLAYLYGYPNFKNSKGSFDDGTKNIIILFLGAMYQIKGVGSIIEKVAQHLAEKATKDIAKAALTKTAWYPVLKEICKTFAIKLTKDSLGKAIGKAIPILGAGISGGLTYYTFSKQSKRLHKRFIDNPVK